MCRSIASQNTKGFSLILLFSFLSYPVWIYRTFLLCKHILWLELIINVMSFRVDSTNWFVPFSSFKITAKFIYIFSSFWLIELIIDVMSFRVDSSNWYFPFSSVKITAKFMYLVLSFEPLNCACLNF